MPNSGYKFGADPIGSKMIPSDVKYIAVEGVIGVGKSTLSKILAERYAARLLPEIFEENPFLEKFYSDQKAYAFQTQLFFLLSRHKQIKESFDQEDLFVKCTVSDYCYDKDRIFASINLSEEEMMMYDTLSQNLNVNLVSPDYVIFLQASPDVLLHRIEKRNRSMEQNMDPGYLKALIDSYNSYFFNYNDAPVLTVNTDSIDFVKNESDLLDLLKVIDGFPPGKTFYNPSTLL